tara:strand:+ start:156 stop:566 length:411 start_codon:yes stop_codon:yes gene_type:complete
MAVVVVVVVVVGSHRHQKKRNEKQEMDNNRKTKKQKRKKLKGKKEALPTGQMPQERQNKSGGTLTQQASKQAVSERRRERSRHKKDGRRAKDGEIDVLAVEGLSQEKRQCAMFSNTNQQPLFLLSQTATLLSQKGK